ncbi:MAG: cyanoexosortase A [Thermosynechococcaceae cyanobacterium]
MQFLKFLRLHIDIEEEDQVFKVSTFCLALLALCHFALDLYLGKQAHLMMSFLLWSSVALLLWDKRHTFAENKDKYSFWLGCILITALLTVSMVRPGEKIVGFFPLLACFGWFLMFVGWAQRKRYIKEFCMLVVFGIPKLIPDAAFGIAPLTAKFSAFVLWYMGYPVLLKDNYIQIPQGGVEVVPACSGMNLMTHMVSVSVLVLCLFPLSKIQATILPLLAILLGFIVNGLRVSVLAALSTPRFTSLFHYWHSASGASIFVLLALVFYGLIFFVFFKPLQEY